MAPAAILETLTPPLMLLERGDDVVLVTGRFARDLGAGLTARFALERDVAAGLEALLARFGAEARFFIFFVPLDLDLLLVGFPGIKSSWLREMSDGCPRRHDNGLGSWVQDRFEGT